MKILVVAHKHPVLFNPRGGEKSMRIIIEHLAKNHEVDVIVKGGKKVPQGSVYTEHNGIKYQCHSNDEFNIRLQPLVYGYDCMLTWGTATPLTAKACIQHNKPYVLMVRWWRLIQPLPPGDLLNRKIDQEFVRRHWHIFQQAKAVITNNIWATKVINRYYDVKAKVSYVPLADESIKGFGNSGGPVLLVTPEKGLGELGLVKKLSKQLPHRQFLLVNCKKPELYSQLPNVTATGYVVNMEEVYQKAGILIYPVYNNDVCGTSRVAAEAMQYGIPCIANDRSGICEKGMAKVSRNARPQEWAEAIEYHYERYREVSNLMHASIRRYNTKKQLSVIQKAIEK